MSLLIRAARVLADDAPDARELLVHNGRIVELGPRGSLSGDEHLDLRDLVLAPGFIDTHVHMTGSGLRSAPDDMRIDPRETLLLRAAANAQRALAEGITTMRDCGAHNDVIFPFKAAANAGWCHHRAFSQQERRSLAPAVMATGGDWRQIPPTKCARQYANRPNWVPIASR